MQENIKERRKILFVITKSNWGGAQRYVFDLATNLPKDKFEVVVAFGGTGEPGAQTGMLHKKLEGAGVRTITLTYFTRNIFLLFDIRAFFELISLLRKERPDILHLNSSKAGGFGSVAGRVTLIPNIIFTSHGLALQRT